MKTVLKALLPKGAIWTPKNGGFFDSLIDGIADSLEQIRIVLGGLADIRNAKKTQVLGELERDTGVAFNSNLTEAQRRAALFSRLNATDNTGSRQELERALQLAGFDVFVYQNSPAVDPRNFEGSYLMTADDENAFADDENAIAGSFESELVVNGDIFIDSPIYFMTAGDENAFADDENALAGTTGQREVEYQYFLPTESALWPFIFLVGGVAEFSITGEIISIERADVPDDRRLEFREIILKYKPEYTWGVLVVNYV